MAVLVVDDDLSTRETFGTLLRLEGFDARLSSDADDAFAISTSEPLSMAFVDVRLQGRSGLDLLRALRNTHSALPVVMMSGYSSVDDTIQAWRLGASDFLEKPIWADTILKIVHSHARPDFLREMLQLEHLPPIVRSTLEFITSHYRDSCLSATDAASELNVSVEHMSRSLRRYTGETFVGLVRKARVDQACWLLVRTHKLIKQVAFECGFGTVHGFEHSFSVVWGTSPSQWRSQQTHHAQLTLPFDSA
jgi:DNA-binding response OmpR family regulator